MSAACDRIVHWGLIALIAFTPLAFGTVEPWSLAIMEWGVTSLILVFLLGRVLSGPPAMPGRSSWTGLEIPVVLFMLFGALQTVPLPAPWLRVLSPGASREYQLHDLRAAALAGPVEEASADPLLAVRAPARRPVSISPPQTWARVRLLAVLAGLFFLVSRWADRGERVMSLLTSVTVVAFLVAVEALVQYSTWNGKIYWVRKVPPSSPFGPFVNHNHFAGYVEMVIPVAISLVFYCGAGRRRVRLRGNGLEAALDDTGTGSARWSQGALALFAAILLIVSLVFTLSRGGVLSAAVSGFVLFLLIARRVASRFVVWSVAAGLPAIALAMIVWIGADTVKERFSESQTPGTEASFRSRVIAWRSLVHHLPEFMWVGAGLGAFEDSFASVMPGGFSKRWDKAHNDYLQVLWETGLAGTSLMLLGGVVFVRRFWWPAVQSRGHPLDLFRVGIAVSLLSIALHSLVDFNLQIGANGFLLALLAGLMVALHRERGSAGWSGRAFSRVPARRAGF